MDTTKLAAKFAAFALSVTVAAIALLLLSAVIQFTLQRWIEISQSKQIHQNNIEYMRANDMTRVLGGPTNFIEYEKAHADK